VPENNPLTFHLDHTTLHRLGFLLTESLKENENFAIEMMNTLHLLESLVLADKIVINSFEPTNAQETSNNLLSEISEMDPTLIIENINSDYFEQKQTSIDTCTKLLEDNILTFNPAVDKELLTNINALAGRPYGVDELISDFWKEVHNNKLPVDRILEKASHLLSENKTDGLFLYGSATHEEFRINILNSYKINGPWNDSHWNKLHVMFRSYFNLVLSSKNNSIYSPPPVRAMCIETAHSKVITNIKNQINFKSPKRFIEDEQYKVFDELSRGTKFQIPMLSLAVIPRINTKDKALFIDNLVEVRKTISDLRNRIRILNNIESTGQRELENQIQSECAVINKDITNSLKLNYPDSFPTKLNDMNILDKGKFMLQKFFALENKSPALLSNIIYRTQNEPDLNFVKSYIKA